MRPMFFIALAAALSAPAAAQKLGERTASPQEVLAQMGSGNSDEEIARAITAASAHPLGTAANPVRVGGPEGERAYMTRLRCADGSPPRIGAAAPAGVGAFGSVVNAYPLDCGAAAPGKLSLVLDMYHAEHREDRAPAGFTMAAR
ncbi:MAG TPA: hypothetical protein VGD10_00445 [Allosphingosinicella sp.]|uniref:hypothetical protein n=1 Tax=Allosphingosinicella sp. TaxID=2823234 RepID=UPI002ED98FE8